MPFLQIQFNRFFSTLFNLLCSSLQLSIQPAMFFNKIALQAFAVAAVAFIGAQAAPVEAGDVVRGSTPLMVPKPSLNNILRRSLSTAASTDTSLCAPMTTSRVSAPISRSMSTSASISYLRSRTPFPALGLTMASFALPTRQSMSQIA
jgi:hypothetical protein